LEGSEVRKSLEEARKNSSIGDCGGESDTVGDGEKLFGEDGERLQSAVQNVVIVVEKYEDGFPYLLW